MAKKDAEAQEHHEGPERIARIFAQAGWQKLWKMPGGQPGGDGYDNGHRIGRAVSVSSRLQGMTHDGFKLSIGFGQSLGGEGQGGDFGRDFGVAGAQKEFGARLIGFAADIAEREVGLKNG